MTRYIIILQFFIFLSFPAFSEWELVNFEGDTICTLGFDGDVVYAFRYRTNRAKCTYISLDKGKSFADTSILCSSWIYDYSKYLDSVYICSREYLYVTGDTLQNKRNIDVFPSLELQHVLKIIDNNGALYVSTLHRGIWKSTDTGRTWFQTYPDDPSGPIFAMETSNDTLFVVEYNNGFFYSTDDGFTWNSGDNSYFKNDDLEFSQIAINKDYKFIATNGVPHTDLGKGVLRTSNTGVSWEFVNEGLENLNVFSIIAVETIIIVGTKGGVFLSRNNGDNWMNVSGIIGDIWVNNLYHHENEVWAATDNGIYKTSIEELITSIDVNIEKDFMLSPNPATDYLEVTLSNHTLKGVVESVRVFDVLGVTVKTPPSPLFLEGESLRLDVSHLPAGVYFVSVGDIVQKFVKL